MAETGEKKSVCENMIRQRILEVYPEQLWPIVDELKLILMSLFIEESFHVRLKDDEISASTMSSLDDLTDFIARKQGS